MSDDTTPPATVPPEAPEADALEQSRDVTPPPATGPPQGGFEVPEADAWEQAQEVPVDDPDAWR
jgi:hypothetical protein